MTSCANCNAPMAADQRYCLNCGIRGGEARLPFLDILRADEGTQVVPYGQPLPPGLAVGAPLNAVPAVVVPPTAQQRLQANTGLIAGVGVLLLAMLIGVLIGSGIGNDPPQAAAAPQPIVVGGAAPVAATAATGPTGTTGADTAAPASSSSSSSSTTKKSSSSSSSSTTKAAPKATNDAVKNLDNLTGKEAQKAADKLGKTIATGGKAPKKDSKPAAGGGSFEDIG